jgi:putative transposase
LGIKTYLTCYDGKEIIEADFNDDKLLKLDKNIKKHQKNLAKKVKYSSNWFKAKAKLEQAYLNFNNYRLDEIHKIVHFINENYDSVTLEDLGMKFVFKNRRLAHKAKQKPFYLFKEALVNKFLLYGKSVYKIPRAYPSTQLCNSCGNVKTKNDKMKLGESVYRCTHCGVIIDRDENAAMNIYNYKNLEEIVLS